MYFSFELAWWDSKCFKSFGGGKYFSGSERVCSGCEGELRRSGEGFGSWFFFSPFVLLERRWRRTAVVGNRIMSGSGQCAHRFRLSMHTHITWWDSTPTCLSLFACGKLAAWMLCAKVLLSRYFLSSSSSFPAIPIYVDSFSVVIKQDFFIFLFLILFLLNDS